MKTQGDIPAWDTSKDDKETDVEVTDESKEIQESENNQKLKLADVEDKNTYESFADRLPKVKKIRNKRLIRRLTLIISIFAVAILIMLYLVSPLSKLGNVTVAGNEVTDSQSIIQKSQLKLGDSLLGQFNNRKTNEQDIVKQLPRVKKASITLNGFNSFKIAIEEHQVVALESTEGGFHPILENGEILSEIVTSNDNSLPVFQQFTDKTVINDLIDAYNQLSDSLKNNISEIVYTPSNANKELVNIHMKDSNIVIVNISEMIEKMAYYDKVASQMEQPGTIDMEVGIFSYPFSSESVDETTEMTSEAIE